jgi:Ca2+/Na+ antiporter
MYSALLLFITTLFVALALFHQLNRISGAILITVFVLYVASIGYAIYKGVTEPPVLSDSDSDSDSDAEIGNPPLGSSERSPLLDNANPSLEPTPPPETNAVQRLPRPLHHHITQLISGLLALSLSGYILAHSAGALADTLHLSGTVFGLTVVAFATTLPEKLIALLGGARGHGRIVVATTAGSNIFLLTLCVGVVAVAGIPVDQANDGLVLFDLVTVWLAAGCFAAVVFLGLGRGAGVVLLGLYGVFLGLELTVFRR